jgi:hypothetical protein
MAGGVPFLDLGTVHRGLLEALLADIGELIDPVRFRTARP